ncbi:MAG: hypothetical protein P4L16_08130 [Chlamydiales bacterium]|nr:hypothetical protein [Chlamydiales bacterium]
MNMLFNTDKEYPLNVIIMLSLQRALLCQVPPNLRMVAVDWNEEIEEIVIYFYFDNKITDEEKEIACDVSGEVSGDFNYDVQIIDKCIYLNKSKTLPQHMCSIYRRKED